MEWDNLISELKNYLNAKFRTGMPVFFYLKSLTSKLIYLIYNGIFPSYKQCAGKTEGISGFLRKSARDTCVFMLKYWFENWRFFLPGIVLIPDEAIRMTSYNEVAMIIDVLVESNEQPKSNCCKTPMSFDLTWRRHKNLSAGASDGMWGRVYHLPRCEVLL